MVSRAKPERVKAHANSRKKELNVAAAVEEYRREQLKPANLGKPKSLLAIATSYNIPYATLHRRVQGGQSIRDANQKKQKLTPIQEWSLVQFLLESADRGFPLGHHQIEQ
ncbi:hypothetical protein B0H14DRAFT_3467526 [Mycena olivaceomarginata]|nr:hypothetical protein B0H14DRAFT_3467526 [Mycena olivaceomarginata]